MLYLVGFVLKRLICQNYKTVFAGISNDPATYEFLFNLHRPNERPEPKQPIISSELASLFKNWYVQNWIDQGNNAQELRYVALLPEQIFDGWIRSIQSKYSNLYPYILEEAKFILKSERVLR
jgi:hypothetical protein